MIKILILLMLPFILFSKNIEKYISYYDVNADYFGKVAEASIDFNNQDNTYIITMNIKPYGMMKSFVFNKQITYISQGIIDNNGILIPLKYSTIEINDKYILKKYFFFNHEQKTIFVEMKLREKKIKKEFIWYKLKFNEDIKFNDKIASYTDDNYYENDFLTFIFNIKNLNFKNTKKYYLKAYGLKNSHQGKISIEKANNSQLKQAKYYFSDINNVFYTSVLKEISDDNKLDVEVKDRFIYLNFDNDYILKNMISEDAFSFGDAKLTRTSIYYKLKPLVIENK